MSYCTLLSDRESRLLLSDSNSDISMAVTPPPSLEFLAKGKSHTLGEHISAVMLGILLFLMLNRSVSQWMSVVHGLTDLNKPS
jgi:hypothetical protein